jgi:hypothetical protein
MMPTTEREKWELVELAKTTWGEEIARLLAEDLGLVPKPDQPPAGDTRH